MFLKYYQVQASIAGASVHAALFTRPSLVDTTHIPELADAVRPLSPLMIGHGKGILFQWIAGSVFSMQQYVRWQARAVYCRVFLHYVAPDAKCDAGIRFPERNVSPQDAGSLQ